MAKIISQEVYLLERYVSAQYFSEMRDAWEAMICVAEKALELFERNLPAQYRNRPLSLQPDIVWGERVLPNFRYTLDCLNSGFIKLTHGDVGALWLAGNVKSDFAGFSRDYSSEWMNEPSVASIMSNASEKFCNSLSEARTHAGNISFTVDAAWSVGALSSRYSESRGPLNPPDEWPLYGLNQQCRVATGESVQVSGIYIPDVDDASAAFMVAGDDACPARVGYDKEKMRYDHMSATQWTLVERIADTGGSSFSENFRTHIGIRCEANQPCPRAGYWLTPAKLGSRRYFNAGEIMPAFESAYGETIWQWDVNQNA